MHRLLEIACFNSQSALLAAEAGANRIELCAAYQLGGVTPAHAVIQQVLQQVQIPVNVIIRPRGSSFVYSLQEVTAMQASIAFCREQKVNGLVLGALTVANTIDVAVCKMLMREAGDLPVTFHRAIDACADLDKSMQQLIDLGISRVLTSGATPSAPEGIKTLSRLQQQYGKHIIIMPGGGIRSSNLQQLLQTGCSEFHSAAITGAGEMADAEEIRRLGQVLHTA